MFFADEDADSESSCSPEEDDSDFHPSEEAEERSDPPVLRSSSRRGTHPSVVSPASSQLDADSPPAAPVDAETAAPQLDVETAAPVDAEAATPVNGEPASTRYIPEHHIRVYGFDYETEGTLRECLERAAATTPDVNYSDIQVKRTLKEKNHKYRAVYKVFGGNCVSPDFVDALNAELGHFPNVRATLFDAPKKGWWNVGTLNVSSIAGSKKDRQTGKKAVLESFCVTHDIDFLALQETERTRDTPAWTFGNYYLLERSPDRLEPGIRGVGLLVKKSWEVTILPDSTPYTLWVKVKCAGAMLRVCSVYIPNHNSPRHPEVKKALAKKLRTLLPSCDTPVILMGDFNTSPSAMKKWLKNSQIQMKVVSLQQNGVPYTFQRGKSKSTRTSSW